VRGSWNIRHRDGTKSDFRDSFDGPEVNL
jgi:hypothetical protein